MRLSPLDPPSKTAALRTGVGRGRMPIAGSKRNIAEFIDP